MMIKPGEMVQYLIAMDSGNGVCKLVLEWSHNNQIWQTARNNNGVLLSYTGTVAGPLTSTIASGMVTNETGRKCLYRFRCVTFDGTNSTGRISWSIINAIQAAIWFDKSNKVCVIVNDNDPTNGTLGDGAGFAEGGSIYINMYSDPKIFFNNGSLASPDWDAM